MSELLEVPVMSEDVETLRKVIVRAVDMPGITDEEFQALRRLRDAITGADVDSRVAGWGS